MTSASISISYINTVASESTYSSNGVFCRHNPWAVAQISIEDNRESRYSVVSEDDCHSQQEKGERLYICIQKSNGFGPLAC